MCTVIIIHTIYKKGVILTFYTFCSNKKPEALMTINNREEAEMAVVQKRVYNALATDLEAQRARSS